MDTFDELDAVEFVRSSAIAADSSVAVRRSCQIEMEQLKSNFNCTTNVHGSRLDIEALDVEFELFLHANLKIIHTPRREEDDARADARSFGRSFIHV